MLRNFIRVVSVAKKITPTYLRHPSVTDPVPSIFSPGFRKKRRRVGKFSGFPFLSGRCFAFSKYAQMMYAGYVKVASGEARN